MKVSNAPDKEFKSIIKTLNQLGIRIDELNENFNKKIEMQKRTTQK